MRTVLEVIEVETQHGQPRSFTWRGRRYRVEELLDGWRYGGRWWLWEAPRDCFLLRAGRLTAELHHEDGSGGPWWLERVAD